MVKNRKPASIIDFRNLIHKINFFYRNRSPQNIRDTMIGETIYPSNLLLLCENSDFKSHDFILNKSQQFTLNAFMNRLT